MGSELRLDWGVGCSIFPVGFVGDGTAIKFIQYE